MSLVSMLVVLNLCSIYVFYMAYIRQAEECIRANVECDSLDMMLRQSQVNLESLRSLVLENQRLRDRLSQYEADADTTT